MKVKTDYKYCDYITAGREYVVIGAPRGGILSIINDDGRPTLIPSPDSMHPCPHLDSMGKWQIVGKRRSLFDKLKCYLKKLFKVLG